MKDIRQLVEKYFDGTTTVAEEQQLRDFFIQDALILKAFKSFIRLGKAAKNSFRIIIKLGN